jgi:hypothetical protein
MVTCVLLKPIRRGASSAPRASNEELVDEKLGAGELAYFSELVRL